TAEAAAELVSAEWRFRGGSPRSCVERVVAQILEKRSMDQVRSGLRHHVHHARGKSSELRALAIRDDAEFLDGIGIWKRVARIPESRSVIAAVEVIADRSGSTGRTIDHTDLGRAPQRICRIRLIHPWSECEKRVKIAIHEREREDLLVI